MGKGFHYGGGSLGKVTAFTVRESCKSELQLLVNRLPIVFGKCFVDVIVEIELY